MKGYVDIADHILKGVWHENHFFQSIGYPLILAGLRNVQTPAGLLLSVVQAICSFITLFCMYQLSLKSLGRKVALISLLIGACHLPWILYGNYALPETIFTCFLALCGLLSLRIVKAEKVSIHSHIAWALFFTLAFWLKGTHAFWGPLFLLSLLLVKKQKAIGSVNIISLVVALGMSLHGILSYQTIGKIQLSASTGGLNFVEGKCPSKRNSDSVGYTWQSPLYHQIGLNEAKKWSRPFTDSSYYFRQGLNCIVRDPLVLLQSFESIPYLFMGNTMWPFNVRPIGKLTRIYELFFAIFTIVGLAVFIFDQLRNKKDYSEIIVWLVPVCSIFLLVYIFKSEIRYRVPYDIWFIPIGVKGWLTLSNKT
jgi:hypothetical protein